MIRRLLDMSADQTRRNTLFHRVVSSWWIIGGLAVMIVLTGWGSGIYTD